MTTRPIRRRAYFKFLSCPQETTDLNQNRTLNHTRNQGATYWRKAWMKLIRVQLRKSQSTTGVNSPSSRAVLSLFLLKSGHHRLLCLIVPRPFSESDSLHQYHIPVTAWTSFVLRHISCYSNLRAARFPISWAWQSHHSCICGHIQVSWCSINVQLVLEKCYPMLLRYRKNFLSISKAHCPWHHSIPSKHESYLKDGLVTYLWCIFSQDSDTTHYYETPQCTINPHHHLLSEQILSQNIKKKTRLSTFKVVNSFFFSC